MKTLTALLLCIFSFAIVSAQNTGIGVGTSNPNASAVLDVTSTNKGLLPPRMTYAQRNAISNPAAGLIIWCSDCLPKGELQVYNGTEWTNLTGGAAAVNYVQLPSVTVGTQIWTLKNLDVANYKNGDPIPKVTDNTQWANLSTPAWCWYNNDSATYAATYGRLYNWYAVTDPRGLCPTGWHVPTDNEWFTMVKFIDPSAVLTSGGEQSSTAGGALKSTTGWSSSNVGATNSTGFTLLPAGTRNAVSGAFASVGFWTHLWTTTNTIVSNPFAWLAGTATAAIQKGGYSYTWGFSVRCIRD